MTELVIGVDIGGTKTAAALVDRAGTVIDQRSAPTPGTAGRRAIIGTVVDLVDQLRAQAVQANDRVVGLGVGSAGVIDSRTGTVLSATAVLAEWAGTDLRSELLSRTGYHVVAVDNDVHTHGWGEAWTGAAAGTASAVFVGVGTGIGASMIVDGAIWHGHRQVAGHFGHLPVPAAGNLPCVCGGIGHLEAVGSGPAMVTAYQRLTGQDPGTLVELAALVTDQADPDPLARTVIVDSASAVGSAIGGLVNLLDPQVVIVGGGVLGVGELWWSSMERAARAELLPPLRHIPVLPAQLGPSAALVGAARLAWEAL